MFYQECSLCFIACQVVESEEEGASVLIAPSANLKVAEVSALPVLLLLLLLFFLDITFFLVHISTLSGPELAITSPAQMQSD